MIGSILICAIVIGGLIAALQQNSSGSVSSVGLRTNVALVDGKQTIHIRAKGGYTPKNTLAKANTPTVLNITTDGTYDCSSSIAIPSLGIRQSLPASGVTPIEIAAQAPGTTLNATCGMGMYRFAVKFE